MPQVIHGRAVRTTMLDLSTQMAAEVEHASHPCSRVGCCPQASWCAETHMRYASSLVVSASAALLPFLAPESRFSIVEIP